MRGNTRALCTALVLVSASLVGSAAQAVPGDDWPQFRHDGQLTGASPLKGWRDQVPNEAWSVGLGAKTALSERARIADVDGDGLPEILLLSEGRIACLNRRGEKLWETGEMPKPKITDILDFTGKGDVGLLVWADTGLEQIRYMISGKTGKAVRLYAMHDVFGMEERIGKILPNVPGIQICAWWSGEHAGLVSSQVGQGFIFGFENGLEAPVTCFKEEIPGYIFSPRHFFADYDQDGETELIVVSHQQMWIYDLKTGRRKCYAKWPMIRTYSASLVMLPVTTGARPSLLSINPHIPGVERVDVDGETASVVWRCVVGGREDQYQTEVKIAPGAPDPFLYLGGDSRLLILVNVTNEHGDGKTCLLVLDGVTGKRLYEEAGLQALCADDLDGDGVPELLVKKDNTFRIVNWKEQRFVVRWQARDVEPLLVPLPSERDLARSTCGNTPVWREAKGSRMFLLKFPDGVFACELTASGLTKGKQIAVHEALSNVPPQNPPKETVSVEDDAVVVRKDGAEVLRRALAKESRYLAPPVVVGDFGGQRRILVKEHSDGLVSYSVRGDDKKLLVKKLHGDQWSVCDMDGDGRNEVVAAAETEDGTPYCVILNAEGVVLRKFDSIENAASLKIGPSGRIGKDGGRWLAVYHDMKVGSRPCVVAYNGKTGERLWLRDHYETANNNYAPSSLVKFVLHVPTAVYDYNGDGADDLLAASENFFGIISVTDSRDLTPVQVFSDYVPGHWQAYANPIVVNVLGGECPQVFHHKAFAQTILTDLEGNPIWHWGMTRDRTASSWPGITDLDGDGKLEIAQTRVDGRMTVFDALPTDQTCPRCPPGQEPASANHGGHVRWEMTLPPPIRDIVTLDVDNDGRGELLFGSGDGSLYALGELKKKPHVKWSYRLGRAVGSPVVADLDADGLAEILVPVEDGRLVCLTLHK